MNEHPAPRAQKAKRRELIRARINTLSTSRQQGMVGPAELVALAGSALILILVIVAYFYFLLPARSRLEALQLERARLQTQLRNSQDVVKKGQTTESTVLTITQSLDEFENHYLTIADRGRISLYDSLNQLIRKNGLRNTSGPTYLPLDPIGSKTASGAARAANTKWQSVYPGIAVSVTVEGQYQSLRRFIKELEATRQFIIINSVELEKATDTSSAPVAAEDGTISSAPAPSLVSLRLEMSTYFQRTGVTPTINEPGN